MRPLCIYHANCNDGFGSALILWQHFKGQIDFWRGYYQSDRLPDCRGREVFIVDFSYPREIMQQIQSQAKSVVWLDHHASAINNMEGFSWRDDVDTNGSSLDPNLSGVGLTHRFLYGDREMTDLFCFIQDWDIWQFKLPDTRPVHFALHELDKDFKIWNSIDDSDDAMFELIKTGKVLVKSHDRKVEGYCRQAFIMDIAGFKVPMVNAPADMASDVGNKLSKDQPFAGIFFETETSRNFSIRSQEGGLDVGVFAKRFGGGGHKHSAGFKINLGRAPLTPKEE